MNAKQETHQAPASGLPQAFESHRKFIKISSALEASTPCPHKMIGRCAFSINFTACSSESLAHGNRLITGQLHIFWINKFTLLNLSILQIVDQHRAGRPLRAI